MAFGRLERCLEEAPDPEAALRRFEQLAADDGLRRRVELLPGEGLQRLVRVLGFSEFLFHFLRREPAAVELCARPLETGVLPADTSPRDLRRYKYRELFKIAMAELSGEWPNERVLKSLTGLAETVLRRVFDNAPDDGDVTVCVLALGKLGAGELNFSSDVDLVFVPSVPEAGDAVERLRQAGARLSERARLLGERTEDGFLYRVDLRLRPWGRDGPLLMPSDAMEDYYALHSDPWERLAWLRARPVAGVSAPGSELLECLQPFIYLRSLGTDDVEGLVQLKHRLSGAYERAGGWDVKRGVGGIRELEFFVQVLQLLHGARTPVLRTTGTLLALDGLDRAGLLETGIVAEARTAYLFLRRVEHALQMIDERQTHLLPAARSSRRLLARALAPGHGATALDWFEERLEWSRAIVRSCFERILPDSSDLRA